MENIKVIPIILILLLQMNTFQPAVTISTASTLQLQTPSIILNGHNKPLIIRANSNFLNMRLQITNAPGSIIENQLLSSLEIIDSENTIARSNIIKGGAIKIVRSSNSTIIDNLVENINTNVGISIFSSNITVKNNFVYRTSFSPETLQKGVFIDNVNSQHWFFQDGIYPPSFNIKVINNTIINYYRGIHIKGNITDITLRNNYIQETVIGLIISRAQNMIIEGNTVEYVNYYNNPELYIRGVNSGILIQDGANYLIEGNHISHIFKSFGIEIHSGVDNVTLIDNVITDASKGGIWTINVKPLIITNNTMIGTNILADDLIENKDYSDSIIHGNTVLNAQSTFAFAGIRARNLDGITISENHILGAEVRGLDIINQNGGHIFGNVIRDIKGHGIELRSDSRSLIIENNQIFNVSGNPIQLTYTDMKEKNTFINNSYEGEIYTPSGLNGLHLTQIMAIFALVVIILVIVRKTIAVNKSMKSYPSD